MEDILGFCPSLSCWIISLLSKNRITKTLCTVRCKLRICCYGSASDILLAFINNYHFVCLAMAEFVEFDINPLLSVGCEKSFVHPPRDNTSVYFAALEQTVMNFNNSRL